MVDDVKYLERVDPGVCAGGDSNCPGVSCEADLAAANLSISEEIQLHMLAIGERLRQHVADVGHQFDFTPQQALLLDRLVNRHTMGQIADALGCDPSNVTGLIRRLEQRGLVAKDVDEVDRRTKWLSLTPAGVEARAAFRRDVFRGSAVLAGLDDEAQEQLLGCLRTIGTNLNAGPACG